jgi:hypothetical protein
MKKELAHGMLGRYGSADLQKLPVKTKNLMFFKKKYKSGQSLRMWLTVAMLIG